MREASSLICIRGRRVLIVQSNKSDHWTFPGGNLEEGEDAMGALLREVREELSGAELIGPQYYTTVEGISPRRKTPIRIFVFLSELSLADVLPSDEIVQLSWATHEEANGLNLSDLSREIINRLRSDGHL